MKLLCTLIRKRQVRQCEAKQNIFDSHHPNPKARGLSPRTGGKPMVKLILKGAI